MKLKILKTPHWVKHFCIRFLLPILCFLLMAAMTLGILVVSVSLMMQSATSPYILTQEDAVKLAKDTPFDCILILGAGLKPDGSPSHMLYDRVKVGSDLHTALGSVPLLMSGDHTGNYNEVAAMVRQAEAFEVDSNKIMLDPKGYSTFESIQNTCDTFPGKRILIVSQTYHLYRAIYIA